MEPVKEVELTKEYDSPIETVWNAWTDPEVIKEWWGPDNVTIPECEIDLRVGGRFYIVMEAGEAMGPIKGMRWPMEATYTSIEPTTKLSYTAKAWTEGNEKEDTTIDQTTELTLSEKDGKTHLYLKAAITAAGSRAGMAVEGMQYGYNQQFVKLEQFLKR